jgi:hypothetical protein
MQLQKLLSCNFSKSKIIHKNRQRKATCGNRSTQSTYPQNPVTPHKNIRVKVGVTFSCVVSVVRNDVANICEIGDIEEIIYDRLNFATFKNSLISGKKIILPN